MNKFNGAEKLAIRNKETGKLIAVYPKKVEGTDEEISKTVKDWYYTKHCSAEDELLTAYVDLLTENELKDHQ